MTTTKVGDRRSELNKANLNELTDLLREMKFGDMNSVIKIAATGLTAAASFDITTTAFKTAVSAAISGITLDTGETLPPIALVQSLRITASGTAASLGNYIAGDVASTMIVPPGGAGVAVGIARISDDGKTITFPNTVTAFTLIYLPRSAVSLTSRGVGPSP